MAKKLLCAIVLMLALVCVLASCIGTVTENTTTHTHDYGEWETTKTATCTANSSVSEIMNGRKRPSTFDVLRVVT